MDRRGSRGRPLIVGFAAETGDATASALELGRAKLARKGCDLLVVNRVDDGRAFGTHDNAATILSDDGTEVDVPLGHKTVLAAAIWTSSPPDWRPLWLPSAICSPGASPGDPEAGAGRRTQSVPDGPCRCPARSTEGEPA